MKYVIIYVSYRDRDGIDHVVFIEKRRPEWQNGRLNLPGGKVEEGETYIMAATRELFEETDLETVSAHVAGYFRGPGFEIGVVRCEVEWPAIVYSKTDEPVSWYPLNDALIDERLIENLRVTLPLLRSGIVGWVIEDNGSKLQINYQELHA